LGWAFAGLWVLAGGLLAGAAAHAAQLGRQPVRLFVPFMAGGEADGSAQNFVRNAARLGDLGLEIIHLTTESGAAAGRAVKQAAPDGRTLLLARVGSVAIQPALSHQTAAPVRDFTVLGVLDQAPLICAVRAGSFVGTEALEASALIHAFRDPAHFLLQQAQFYERLVTTLEVRQ
jgi:tripartite-type tricarboxylate transporter receptor subunit TctC